MAKVRTFKFSKSNKWQRALAKLADELFRELPLREDALKLAGYALLKPCTEKSACAWIKEILWWDKDMIADWVAEVKGTKKSCATKKR